MTQPDSTINTGAVGALREAIDAGLKAFCSCTPDFTMSSAMRRDAADFIMAQPGTFRTTPTPASEAEVIERCAKVAESEIGIASGYRSGGSFGAARVDQGRIIAAAIRALYPTKEPRDD